MQRHTGEDAQILANREQVYQKAKSRTPERWSGDIRNWEQVQEVLLNPEKCKSEAIRNKAA